jgi:hypothetical protein
MLLDKEQQIAKLELHRRELWFKVKRKGNWHAPDHWKFKTTSVLPRALYWQLTSYVFRLVKKARKKKSISALQESIRDGLADLAEVWGCKWVLSKSKSTFTFLLGHKKFYTIRIIDFHNDPIPYAAKFKKQEVLRDFTRRHSKDFRRMEKDSKALCRGAWIIFKGYHVQLVTGETRRED